MRSRSVAASIAVTLSMTLASAGLAQAAQKSAPAASLRTTHQRPFVGAEESCYHQLQRDTGNGVVSQRFEPDFAAYNTRGADDFTVSDPCRVRSVDVVGTHFSGAGPAASHEIVLYGDGGGRPGSVITRQTVVGPNANGSYHLPLTKALRLEPGTYWLSVRANLDFVTGLWGWEVASVATGSRAMWKNPGDGFGVGCTTYQDMQTCLGDGASGPDFMFSVNRTR